MLLVCDNRAATRKEAPPWMEGAGNLQTRDGEGKRYWGVGDGYLCGPQERAQWRDIDDGYSVAIVGALDPRSLARDQRWCDTSFACDMSGRAWACPLVLAQSGARRFRSAYGADYLPLLTSAQDRAEKVARAAADALTAAHAGTGAIPMQVACAWAAELLSIANHVTPQILGVLGLLDDALIGAALYRAAGFMPEEVGLG